MVDVEMIGFDSKYKRWRCDSVKGKRMDQRVIGIYKGKKQKEHSLLNTGLIVGHHTVL